MVNTITNASIRQKMKKSRDTEADVLNDAILEILNNLYQKYEIKQIPSFFFPKETRLFTNNYQPLFDTIIAFDETPLDDYLETIIKRSVEDVIKILKEQKIEIFNLRFKNRTFNYAFATIICVDLFDEKAIEMSKPKVKQVTNWKL